jgi:hypothetical protein
MMVHATPTLNRRHELLADRALCGINAADERELSGVLALTEEGDLDDWGYDLTVAALDQALSEPMEREMPPDLRDRVQSAAVHWLAQSRGLSLTEPTETGTTPAPVRRTSAIPWLMAAACLLLAAIGWWRLIPRTPEAMVARSELLNAADVSLVTWAENDLGVRGDVVWSDELQRGYLRFVGLGVNDPDVEQYQLWIFDKNRTVDFPVDGGIFNIRATPQDARGETIVPIDAKIPVNEATLFAVTIEPPGGVVVSDRSRLILAATVKQ